jgi:prepilin-type N-terminal cleavage/methylation domain-containing protein
VPTRDRQPRGFTLIEMMIVLAIVGVIAGLAGFSMTRTRPRASLAGTVIELRAALHQARLQALASGAQVVVMVFPGVSGEASSLGRVVIYQDNAFDFFNTTSAVHFGNYDALALKAGPRGEVTARLDLPRGVTFGPATGLGTSATLPAPFATIPVRSDCTFCAGTGAARRGAVVFDPRGRASFHDADGPALAVAGGSISVTSAELQGATPLVRMLAITATTGSLQSVNLD